MNDINNLLSSLRNDDIYTEPSKIEENKSDSFVETTINYWLNNHISEINNIIENSISKMIIQMFENNNASVFDKIFTEKLQQEIMIRFYNMIINDDNLKNNIIIKVQEGITDKLIQSIIQETIIKYVSEKFSK